MKQLYEEIVFYALLLMFKHFLKIAYYGIIRGLDSDFFKSAATDGIIYHL